MIITQFLPAVATGDEPRVRELLTENPDLAHAKDAAGVSSILVAAYNGHAALARYLADAKGAIDIFEAAALGDEHALASLLADGRVAIDGVNVDGFHPLGLAAYFGRLETVQGLLRRGANPNIASKNALGVLPLHSALSGGHKQIAEVLINAGTDVNTPSAEGWTPLRYTAETNDIETTRILLAKGATVSRVEIVAAEAKGYDDLAKLLTSSISP